MAKKRTRTDRNEREEEDYTKTTITNKSDTTLPASKQQRAEQTAASDASSVSSSDSSSSDSSEGEDEVDGGVEAEDDAQNEEEEQHMDQSDLADEDVATAIVPTGTGPKVIVVLEHANLEAVKNGKVS
jgi:hypothetical protein